MSKLIKKSHNVSILLYHFVCPAKYRRAVFDSHVDEVLKEVCLEIAKRYQIEFLEIGTDKNHVHFLIQAIPTYSPKQIIQMVKSLTAREIFKRAPEVKKQLWGVNSGAMATMWARSVEKAMRRRSNDMCNNKVRQRNTSNCTSNNYTCSTRSSNSDTPQLAAA